MAIERRKPWQGILTKEYWNQPVNRRQAGTALLVTGLVSPIVVKEAVQAWNALYPPSEQVFKAVEEVPIIPPHGSTFWKTLTFYSAN